MGQTMTMNEVRGPRGDVLAKAGAAALLMGIPIYLAIAATSGADAVAKPFFTRLFTFLEAQPFALVFLVVTGGYLLGRIQVRGIGLGPTGATLILALELSVWALAGEGIQFEIAGFASSIFFNLFMFAVGMKVGPQFVAGIRGNGVKFVIIAVIIPITSFLLTVLLRALFHYPPGFAAGILSGANTATPGLGAAQTAYSSGAAHVEGELQTVLGNLSTSFAFSYSITIVLFVLMMKVLPRIFGRDAAAEARDYMRTAMGGGAPLPGEAMAFQVGTLPVATRAYRLEREALVGKRVGQLREATPMVAVERVLRGGRTLEADDGLVLQRGDVIALFGTVEKLVEFSPRVGPEFPAPELRETSRETVDVVLNKPTAYGRRLNALAHDVGHGVYLNAMFRGGQSIPFGPDLVTEKNDVLRVTASPRRIARLVREAGAVVRPSMSSDIVTLGLGLSLGALLGAVTVPVGPIQITLGPAVGLLIVGIALGAIRTRHPEFGGPFPEPARKLLEDLGLSVFVAILGLTSGVGVVQAIRGGGVLPIVVSALIVGLVPPLMAWLIGLYALKMNSALLLGAVAGGSASAAGLNASQEASSSTVPAIAYPVAFAIGNILLTLLAYVMALMG
jgi:putative transport protein